MLVHHLNACRDLIVPGDYNATLLFCVEHLIAIANQSIKDHGAFFIALSGGSTPKAIFEKLTSSPYKERMPWDKTHFFWSDERTVPPDHPDSNYHMAMQAGLKNMPIPPPHIHRMVTETDLENNAHSYEKTIQDVLKEHSFDLMMLGMGEDGHTASLFPNTEGLKVENRLAIPNYIPEKKTWRMTLTFPCINAAKHIAIYVMGISKKETLASVLQNKANYPVLQVGTPQNKALWIVDQPAATNLKLGES